MNNLSADLFLRFSHFPLLFLITLWASVRFGKVLFLQTIVLMSLNILINVALKGTFKVPLPAHLHPGYAFPSGHMQLATVFYLWWGIHFSAKIWRSLILVLLTGIGASLIFYGYHNLYEVIGGFGCGVCVLGAYYYGLRHHHGLMAQDLFLLGSFLMLYIAFVYQVIPLHASIAYAILLIIIFAEHLWSKKKTFHNT